MKNLENNKKDLQKGNTRVADKQAILVIREYCENQLGRWGTPKYYFDKVFTPVGSRLRVRSSSKSLRMKWFVSSYQGNEDYIHRKLSLLLKEYYDMRAMRLQPEHYYEVPRLMIDNVIADFDEDGFYRVYVEFNRMTELSLNELDEIQTVKERRLTDES